ncbi:MAG: hypothetical protein ACRD1Z_04960 [Vicinamibacteria bacterium]
MSFDKDYPNRKDRRKPYRGSKRFDSSCRHGGRCGWCRGNRTFNTVRRKTEAEGRVG